jgi:hypothetical protein
MQMPPQPIMSLYSQIPSIADALPQQSMGFHPDLSQTVSPIAQQSQNGVDFNRRTSIIERIPMSLGSRG